MMKNALYGGVNAAVLTAMNEDLSVDFDRMAAHSQWLLANGCDGLGVLGTTGEANSIGVNERMEILEGLVACGVPAARMMPGTVCLSVAPSFDNRYDPTAAPPIIIISKGSECVITPILPPARI